MADTTSDAVVPVAVEEPQAAMNVDGAEAAPQDPGKRKREEGDEEVDDNKKTKATEDAASAVQSGEGAAEMDESGGDAQGGEGPKGDGDSDVLKIMVYGFKKWDNQHQVSSWLAKNNVKFDKLKRIPHTTAAQLRFETKEERDAAMEHLKTAIYKGKTLFVTLGRDDVGTRIRNGEGGGAQGSDNRDNGKGRDGRKGGKGRDGEGGEVKKRTLLEVVTPLFETPYEQQVADKAKTIKTQCVDKVLREIKHAYRTKIKQRHQGGGKTAWVEMPSYLKGGDKAIMVEAIKPAPQIMAYRNKCEFTVGRDAAGEPTVGFRLSTFEEGVTVASPEQCPNLDDHTKRVAEAMQRFIRSSRLPVWDMVENTGVWRLVTVRTSARTQQCLVLLCVSVSAVGEVAWKEEEARLRHWLTAETEPPLEPPTADGDAGGPADDEEGKGSWLGVTSLFVQVFEGRSSPDANTPVYRSWGRPYLDEELLGLKFRISPTAFFQTSTAAAEVLYGVVADWCTRPSPLPPSFNEAEAEAKGKAGDDGASVTTAATEGEKGSAEEGEAQGGDDATIATTATTTTAAEGEGQKGEEEQGKEGEGAKGWEPLSEGRESVLLDVCCGTGTIGLCCASTLKHKAVRVLGIEMCSGAVEDAWVNAAANGVDNAAFMCCKAEEVLNGGLQPGNFCPSEPDPTNVRELLQHAVNEGSPVLAIVDPPRDGLHIDCVRSIRACECIKRLIYVSCNPTGSLVRDGLTLCSAPSKRLFGKPFRPVAAVPVDMFPHTPHCECVMIFERD